MVRIVNKRRRVKIIGYKIKMQQHFVDKIKISGVEKEDEFVSKSIQKLSVMLLALLLIVGLIPASVSAASNPSVNLAV